MTVLQAFLAKLNSDAPIPFQQTLALIDAHYDFTPRAFTNGEQHNAANQNNGACKCFAFARLQQLSPEQTLRLFGEHYADVLAQPKGENHPNIRQFMQRGWAGVQFEGEALQQKAAE